MIKFLSSGQFDWVRRVERASRDATARSPSGVAYPWYLWGVLALPYSFTQICYDSLDSPIGLIEGIFVNEV